MKKTLLFGLFISLAFSCCSCSNDPHSMTSVVNPSVSPNSSSDVSADTKSQLQSTPKIISPADAQTQSLIAPKIITPASGSMGGGYVCLYKDNVTSKIVIATSYHAGGFRGNAYGVDFYNINHGKASKITLYQQVSQDAGNYDKSDLLKNAKLFYGDNDLPYTKSTILDAQYVTEYDVSGK